VKTVSIAAWLVVFVACASPPRAAPIAPAALPAAPVPYDDQGRSFVAPADGKLVPKEDKSFVAWAKGRAGLTVSTMPRGQEATSDESVVNALKAISNLDSERLMKEEREGAIVICLENAPPSTTAACARIDADSRRGGALVLTTFVGDADVYASLGGARVAAEAARSARGFGAPEALPPP
jgi:hypothetical protein